MISPSIVMAKAENKKPAMPARTESDSSVSKTLVVTLPQTMVASTWLEFFRKFSTRAASALPPSASICRRNWLKLNAARLRPENIADCRMQRTMPAQTQPFGRSARLGSAGIEFAIQDMTDDMDHLTLLKAAGCSDGQRRSPRVAASTYIFTFCDSGVRRNRARRRDRPRAAMAALPIRLP